MMLIQQLIDTCSTEQKETLQAVEYGMRMVQLLIQDLTDLQKMKYETFKKKESKLCIKDALNEIVSINTI